MKTEKFRFGIVTHNGEATYAIALNLARREMPQ
jgi:hypothetical protein